MEEMNARLWKKKQRVLYNHLLTISLDNKWQLMYFSRITTISMSNNSLMI
jgi:hypothetical protein